MTRKMRNGFWATTGGMMMVLLSGGCNSDFAGFSLSTLTWRQITIANQTAGIDTSRAGFVVLEDFDQNGWLDAASGFESSGAVVIHIQNSPQNWTSAVIAQGLGPIRALASADIDRSGQPDLVVAGGNGTVWLLLAPAFSGTPTGGWRISSLPNPVPISAWDDVEVAQFDELDQLQIVATSAANGVIVLWRAETFVTSAADYKPFVIASVPGTGFTNLKVADVDGDDEPDLIASGPVPGILWLENLGKANLTGPWFRHTITTQTGLTRLAVGDLQNNNRVNVIATDRAGGRVFWYENLGSPRTDIWPQHLIANLAPGQPNALSISDLDNDGVLDLLVGTSQANQSIYWLRRFNDPRAPWQVQLITRTGFDVGELPVGDIDKNQRIDFATTLAGSATPVVWFQQQ